MGKIELTKEAIEDAYRWAIEDAEKVGFTMETLKDCTIDLKYWHQEYMFKHVSLFEGNGEIILRSYWPGDGLVEYMRVINKEQVMNDSRDMYNFMLRCGIYAAGIDKQISSGLR